MDDLVGIMSRAGADRVAGEYGVSAGVDATGVIAWATKRYMARSYHNDLADLAAARYDRIARGNASPAQDDPGAPVFFFSVLFLFFSSCGCSFFFCGCSFSFLFLSFQSIEKVRKSKEK